MKNHLFALLLGMASITALWAQREKLLPLVLPLKQVILPAQEQSTKVAICAIITSPRSGVIRVPLNLNVLFDELTNRSMPPEIFLLKTLNQN